MSDPLSPVSASSRPPIFWAAAALILIVGFGLHARRAPAVFAKEGLLLPDPDDYMRLHRARLITEGRCHVVRHLDAVNWPRGATLHWTAPMDYLLAGAGLIFGPLTRHADPLGAVGAWAPVALGILYAALFMLFLKRALGEWVAILAGCVLILSSGFQSAFRLGHTDHHALLELLSLLAVAPWLRRGSNDTAAPPHCRSTAILSGIATGMAIWVSPQALIPWAAVLIGLVFARFHDSRERRPQWDALRLFWCASSACIVLIASAVENGADWLTPTVDRVSVFQVGVVVLGLLLPIGVGRRTLQIERMVFFLIACAAFVPWMIARREAALGPMTRPEFFRWSSLVTELQPLYTIAGRDWTLKPMHEFFGYFPYLLPVFMFFFARSKQMDCGARLTFILLAAAFTLLSIVQLRWVDHWNTPVIPIAVVGAIELVRLFSRASPHPAVAGIAFVVLAALSYPIIKSEFALAASQPDPIIQRAYLVADAIKSHETRNASPGKPHAILCDQTDGPLLLYETRLPVVAAPYHRALDGLVAADRFYAETDPSAARRQLHELDVHYVVIPQNAIAQIWQFEKVAFGEFRASEEPERRLDKDNELMIGLRFRTGDAFMKTMAFRLTMMRNVNELGLRPIASIQEGAPTPDGQSGLLYEVAAGPPAR